MKKLSLSDPYFNEVINGSITRRAIVNELLSTREVFPLPIQKWFGKAQNVILVIFLLALFSLSAYTIAAWTRYDVVRKNTIREIYDGTTTDAARNKRAMMEEVK